MKSAIAAILAAASLAGLAGCESDAVPSTSLALRYQVDSERQRSWWLTREGIVIHSAAASPKAVTLPGWLWVDSPYCAPDLALGPKGEVIVTSNVVSTVWRIDPENFVVTVHALPLDADTDKDVGFAAVVYSAEQAAFIAYSDAQRSVWKIDPALNGAVKLGQADLVNRQAQRSPKSRMAPCGELGRRLSRLAMNID